MKNLRSIGAMALMTACAPFAACGATYYTYSYKGIEVTSSAGAENAKTTAHNLSRLDRAITAVMRIEASEWRPPTEVYAMPEAVFSRVRGVKDDALSLYISNPLGNTIEVNATNTRDNEMFGAYFGYTGSVLLNAYTFRYPPWFVRGLSETFGASVINKTTVTIGEPSAGRVRPLLTKKLIPIRELLAVQNSDPQMKSPDYLAQYSAESWLLVHLIVLEGKYYSNFFKYFRLRDQGEDDAKAFTASFDVTYEDLDKMLDAVVKGGKITLAKVAIPDDIDSGVATRLTDAEAAGRLAALAAIHGAKPDDALQMANEAIALAPANPDALFALAHVQMRRADYASALQAADKLCSLDSLPQKAVARCGALFTNLAGAINQKKADVDVERQALAERRSRQYYEKAITMDPDDIGSVEGVARVLYTLRNAEYSQAFLPLAQKTLSTHPRASSLARALSGLCASMGNNVMALNYALMWQNAALSDADRDAAASYVSRLKESVDRNNLRNAAGPH
jgi:tetratricopeptide (TPR) repeat protein